ncbi:MAG: ParB/RepB/Spo0J family partition protein [Alphaproteobacteria bacterium]|nr:ParB/RepB/Spo0J family partition protein [Alphaproteobacteria bacterium]
MSTNKKHGLGRGLEALLGEDDLNFSLDNINTVEITDTGIKTLPIDKLAPSSYQPRTEFNQEALEALVTSVKEKGVLQPLLVRKQGEKYEIIAGERRWRAAKMAGLNEVPVIEKDLDNQEVLEVALVENLLRENLSAIEEAEGFNRLITEFSHTHEALSQIVGKSRSYITNTLRLLSLPADVQEMIKNNSLTAGHARALIGLDNAKEIADKIVLKGLTVRQTEDLVNNLKNHKMEQISRAVKKDPNLKELEKDLTKNIGLKVKINAKENDQGKVTIEYKNPAELNAILELLEKNKQ